MKSKTFFLCFFCSILLTATSSVLAQCNESHMHKAAARLGPNTQLKDYYNISFESGTIQKPVPTGNFKVQLNRGSLYRFSVITDSSSKGQAVLQIYDQKVLLGSTYDHENESDNSVFDFECSRTKTYDILLFFREGKAGCATGIVSTVITKNDSPLDRVTDSTTKNDSIRLETLYIGLDNPLYISTSKQNRKAIKVSIDQGTIFLNETGYYTVRVKEVGEATVTVLSKYKDSRGDEETTIKFKVEEKPLPKLLLEGTPDKGVISRSTFELDNPSLALVSAKYDIKNYRIKQFDIRVNGRNFGYMNSGARLSNRNWMLLQTIDEESIISFNNIIVGLPTGKELELPPFIFSIE